MTIDLLPKQERGKETRYPVIPVVGIVVFVAFSLFVAYTYINLSSSVKSLEQSIGNQAEQQAGLEQELESRTTGITEYNYVDYYTALDQALRTMFAGTVELQNNVHALLPDNAKVESYSYANSGDLSMIVTLDSKGDAGMYLHNLLQAQFVDSAEVQSIHISDEEELFYTMMYQLKLRSIAGDGQ